jgi:hypothetical protein
LVTAAVTFADLARTQLSSIIRNPGNRATCG